MVRRPREEVLICIHVFPGAPKSSDEDAVVERPVPPEVPERAVERVRAPVDEKEEVAD